MSPIVNHGAYPAKAVVGEEVTFRAHVFREGHDEVGASIAVVSPTKKRSLVELHQVEPVGLDIFEGSFRPSEPGTWKFELVTYSDEWGTWLHAADAKLPIDQDRELVLAEGLALVDSALKYHHALEPDDEPLHALRKALTSDRDVQATAHRIDVDYAMRARAPRTLATRSAKYQIEVSRRRALYSSWYEFFPRSQGAEFDPQSGKWRSGTFDTCHDRLCQIAQMGFHIVYLPPIHPIGSAFRKGKNNSLEPSPEDPGSPWAIGSSDGGHDAIHPDLGDIDSFDRFVRRAHELGLEVALDFALQASPDHPWVTEHPEWFTTRLDGTIAYAENPPKKYQDIYPINFDNDPDGIYDECLRLINYWISHGVTIFRVDNPHTKPVQFWEWLIHEVHDTHPEVIFLAEAFTRPEMMHALGKIGFDQSYTYFTWRNEKHEIVRYLTELSQETPDFFRPNFFPTTPDINPLPLQCGLPSAFAIRAVLAATLSPSWGIYSGFELFEHAPLRPGGEEYLDSEKYEYRPRNYDAEPNLNLLLTRLNQLREAHPALQQLRNIRFHHVDNDQILAFSKRDGPDSVIVVCSLDPTSTVSGTVSLDLVSIGYAGASVVNLKDELNDWSYQWGGRNYVELSPAFPVHILVPTT